METTKNYIGSKLLIVAFFLINSLMANATGADEAAASTLTEDQKSAEIISYIAMGVGTILVIWIAYFLSNRSGGSDEKPSRPSRIPRIRIRTR